jgi:hypothetical protein
MIDTHLTVRTQFIDVGGDRFAYRRWGNTGTEQPPYFSSSTSVVAWIIGIH